jgi:hypothetical protein
VLQSAQTCKYLCGLIALLSAFPWWLLMLNIFSCSHWLLFVCLLLRKFYLSLFPILKSDYLFLLSYFNFLYILDITPYQIYSLKIFSPIMWGISSLSFSGQLFSLM